MPKLFRSKKLKSPVHLINTDLHRCFWNSLYILFFLSYLIFSCLGTSNNLSLVLWWADNLYAFWHCFHIVFSKFELLLGMFSLVFMLNSHFWTLLWVCVFFCDFRYFLAEIEGLEQKSDSEVEKGLLMLLDSDLPALKVDFLELQNSKWRASNCVGK